MAGQTAAATSAMAANGSPCPPPSRGSVRYSAPAVAETDNRRSAEVRWGSRCPAMPEAATAVAVPEPKPPATAPATTSGSSVVAAAVP